ncbi:Asp-tRNA(Asn)/Glu-tRNA(Gln) amidotransferase subunit GatB [Candidatus Finniella inopinata]|uniref:Aspartyl/glutamyl-tRNA(Asn/Gln) amidotransferase subunit B n=1 Tax=Candidatus Finniella inopinata TaxID=1696036 RepID=A0A4V2DZK5_9PROT|nr:Asp-tRNA(Asn)/Glu-tRNA(Gln) amidotransferase subunit GatB [Candidatus Finniella inopinata]
MVENENLVQGRTGQWEVIIGLEIHAQIAAKAKLFSGSSTDFGSDPNTQVSFLDAGMPGMLPIINKVCVDQAIKTGLGFHGHINEISVFDRKNYFYADLPTGYQISQFHYPIVTGGYIDIELEGKPSKRIAITRLHLEQDAGKSIHDLHPDFSYIDLNRAGMALMEIVSEPEMRSPAQAMAYVKKLRSLVRYLGTCDGNMEQGSMRVDANISLCRPGEPFGTRAEIKNVNSIRFLGQALDYEIYRQLEILEEGGAVVQETRLFDPVKGETRSMRGKENAHDYRYFPDPDLKPLVVTQERIEAIRATMTELPDDKRNRFQIDYGLSDYDANVLVAEKEIADYYETVVKAAKSQDTKQAAKLIANWLIGEVFGAMNRESLSIHQLPFPSSHLAELVDLIMDGTISGKIAKDVFVKMWTTAKSPADLVADLGLQQISDTSVIEAAIDQVLKDNADKVDDYKSGKVQLFGFFIGLIMKALKGKANPGLVNDILKSKL